MSIWVYSEYTAIEVGIVRTGNGYHFNDNSVKKAKDSGFAEYFDEYITNDNEISSTSITNNETLLFYLKEYFEN